MIPNLRSKPICLCAFHDLNQSDLKARIIMLDGASLSQVAAGFAALAAAFARLGNVNIPDFVLDSGIMLEMKNAVPIIDYAAIEKRAYSLMAHNPRLSIEEFNSILKKLPAPESRDESEYKRKPWLRMQDAYNQQKTRRTGRPKKGR